MKYGTSLLTIMLPIIVIVLFIGQIFFTNDLAHDGSTLKTITQRIDTLEVENALIEEKIASQSSLFIIQEKANAMGFVQAKDFLTIAQGQYLVAFNQKR